MQHIHLDLEHVDDSFTGLAAIGNFHPICSTSLCSSMYHVLKRGVLERLDWQ